MYCNYIENTNLKIDFKMKFYNYSTHIKLQHTH